MNRMKLFALLCFLCSITSLSAKTGFSITERLVRISQKNSKTFRTGFLLNYKGETAVICTQSAFLPGVVITNKAGHELNFSKVLVPVKKEKSNILILIISNRKPKSKCLTIHKELDNAIKPGDMIDVQGYSLENQQLYTGKGKISKIGERQIYIDSKVRRNITGAPVISSKTKQLLGVAICKKLGKVEMSYAERIDNLANFSVLTAEDIASEAENLLQLSSSVIHYSKTFRQIKCILDKIHYTEQNMNKLKRIFKKLGDQERKEFKEQLTKLAKELKTVASELKKQQIAAQQQNKIVIPSFIKLFHINQMRADEIIERKCEPNEKMLEKVIAALDTAY